MPRYWHFLKASQIPTTWSECVTKAENFCPIFFPEVPQLRDFSFLLAWFHRFSWTLHLCPLRVILLIDFPDLVTIFFVKKNSVYTLSWPRKKWCLGQGPRQNPVACFYKTPCHLSVGSFNCLPFFVFLKFLHLSLKNTKSDLNQHRLNFPDLLG